MTVPRIAVVADPETRIARVAGKGTATIRTDSSRI
jgi:hypothetical protein